MKEKKTYATVIIRMAPDLKNQLQVEAKKNSNTMAGFMAQLFRNFLEKEYGSASYRSKK